MITFEVLWKNLQTHLTAGTIINNWTAYSGNLGDTMRVKDVNKVSISIDAPKAEYFQVIPRKDFEAVWQLWGDYKTHKVKRYELRDITRFSKYIISVLHWYEEQDIVN